MIIKKFTGKTEQEATDIAKKELGEGIVIMNVRPMKRTGVFSFLKPQRIEVTVALEEENVNAAGSGVISPQSVPETPAQAAPETSSVLARRLQSLKIAREEGIMTEEEAIKGRLADVKAPEPADLSFREPELKPIDPSTSHRTEEDLLIEITPREKPRTVTPNVPLQELTAGSAIARAASEGKLPPLKVSPDAAIARENAVKEDLASMFGQDVAPAPAAPKPAPAPPPPPAPVTPQPAPVQERTDNSAIEQKLDNLHTLLEQNIKSPEPVSDIQDEAMSFIKILYNTLLENEVDERYANELTDEVEKIAKPDMPLDYALANVYQKMVLKFGASEVIAPAKDGGPKAEVFIGPTGVGKTTTIAKLASLLHVTEKKKVCLLTVDTYRIAAAEQLRTYASILEIPFRVIYSVEEMKHAAEDFRDFDYIMVDTAGHSLHNEEQKTNIVNFINALSEEMETDSYLVLSATTKYRDLIEITDTYAAMVKYKLIFSKMDETGATGNLYNIRLHTGAPMSYITNGQDVPDDIEEFNAQKIVKVLLGGKALS